MPPDGRILLLAVMLDSGPYIEQGESRLRTRQAVLDGLNESGFVPKGQRAYWIRHCTVAAPREPGAFKALPRRQPSNSVGGMRAVDRPGTSFFRAVAKRVCPLAARSASFDPCPLERFAALITMVENIHITIGREHRSGQPIQRDCKRWCQRSGNSTVGILVTKVLHRDGCARCARWCQIISPRATAPDRSASFAVSRNSEAPKCYKHIIEELRSQPRRQWSSFFSHDRH